MERTRKVEEVEICVEKEKNNYGRLICANWIINNLWTNTRQKWEEKGERGGHLFREGKKVTSQNFRLGLKEQTHEGRKRETERIMVTKKT